MCQSDRWDQRQAEATTGQILFSAATTYADGAYSNYTIQANGTGSKIDLSHLNSMAGSNLGYNLAVTASGGCEARSTWPGQLAAILS